MQIWVVVPNVDPRPDRFEMDPSQLAVALVRGRRAGLAPLVFVHSHVGGRPEPSARDRAGLFFRGLLWWPRTWILIQVVGPRGLGARALWSPGARQRVS